MAWCAKGREGRSIVIVEAIGNCLPMGICNVLFVHQGYGQGVRSDMND